MVLVAGVAVVASTATVATAGSWTSAPAGSARSSARSLGAGNIPTASNVNSPAGNVTLSWTASALTNGGPNAAGYLVKRYDARSGAVQNGGNAVCSPSGTTCSESGVPGSGTWQYAVVPNQGSWSGTESSHSADVNVGAPTPVAGSVSTSGSNGNGKPDKGDVVKVAFTQRMKVSSLCSTWSTDSSDQSLSGNNVVTVKLNNNAGSTGNDTLTVITDSSHCGGAPPFGTFDLGSSGYVTGNQTCLGSGSNASQVGWAALTSTLTVTLGTCGPTVAVASSTLTYTPNAGVQNSTGTGVTGSATSAAVQQF